MLMLHQFPEEQKILGRILTGYGELEYALARCVGSALNDDSIAFRCVFRIRGETSRIHVADALMRPSYEKAGLKDRYETILGAMRQCKKIRNQFAHAHWLEHETAGLFFTDMDKAANTSSGQVFFSMHHVDMELLIKQEQFFDYTYNGLMFLSAEHEKVAGRLSSHPRSFPKAVSPPPLHNPPEKHPLPYTRIADDLPPAEPSQGDQQDE